MGSKARPVNVALRYTFIMTCVKFSSDAINVKLRLRKTGNSLATTWPKEILNRLNVGQGDTRGYIACGGDGAWGVGDAL